MCSFTSSLLNAGTVFLFQLSFLPFSFLSHTLISYSIFSHPYSAETLSIYVLSSPVQILAIPNFHISGPPLSSSSLSNHTCLLFIKCLILFFSHFIFIFSVSDITYFMCFPFLKLENHAADVAGLRHCSMIENVTIIEQL